MVPVDGESFKKNNDTKFARICRVFISLDTLLRGHVGDIHWQYFLQKIQTIVQSQK